MAAIIMIGAAIVILILLYFLKFQDDDYINKITLETGSCYLGGECLHATRSLTPYIIGGTMSAVLFLIGFYFLMEVRTKKNESKEKPEEAPATDHQLFHLGPEEKMLYDFIKEKQGSVFQSDLVKQFNLSKVKVTRILDRLESGGLIERRRRGMTNLVIIKR